MANFTISTKSPQASKEGVKPADWEIKLEITQPDTLPGFVEMLDEDIVYALAWAQYRVKFQETVRSLAMKGTSDEKIQEYMESWKPGDRIESSRDPLANIMRNASNCTAEQLAQILAQLQARANEMSDSAE